MTTLVLFAVLCFTTSALSFPQPKSHVYENFNFVTREHWEARPPEYTTPLSLPVPFVVIHHTYIPAACFTFKECSASMRAMQNAHQLQNGWEDIGYNFAVGSDGVVYEGRGWEFLGSHAYGYNFRSIGITLIGDWRTELPPAIQLETTKKLISEGVKLGFISETYGLIGHQQVRATECPGDALFREIKTWDRFQPHL